MHISTTAGINVFWAFTRVVKSIPNILFMYFISGRQSFGTFSEHFLWAFRPQSEKEHCNDISGWNYFTSRIKQMYTIIKIWCSSCISPTNCISTLFTLLTAHSVRQFNTRQTASNMTVLWTNGFYARRHTCYSAYMPRQFRLSVHHTRALCQNGWTHHRNSFAIWYAHHSSFFITKDRCSNLTASPPTGAPNTRG